MHSVIGLYVDYIIWQVYQVYKGCTAEGINVAVKVQRPNLHHVVVRDIYILRLGVGFIL